MTTLTIDLPEDLINKLDNQDISDTQLQRLIIDALEHWLGDHLQTERQPSSPIGANAPSWLNRRTSVVVHRFSD